MLLNRGWEWKQSLEIIRRNAVWCLCLYAKQNVKLIELQRVFDLYQMKSCWINSEPKQSICPPEPEFPLLSSQRNEGQSIQGLNGGGGRLIWLLSLTLQTPVVTQDLVCMNSNTELCHIWSLGYSRRPLNLQLQCCSWAPAHRVGLDPRLVTFLWGKKTWQSVLRFCTRSLVSHSRSSLCFLLILSCVPPHHHHSSIPTPLWKPCCYAGGPTASWPSTPPWRTPTWSHRSSGWWGASNICTGIFRAARLNSCCLCSADGSHPGKDLSHRQRFPLRFGKRELQRRHLAAPDRREDRHPSDGEQVQINWACHDHTPSLSWWFSHSYVRPSVFAPPSVRECLCVWHVLT